MLTQITPTRRYGDSYFCHEIGAHEPGQLCYFCKTSPTVTCLFITEYETNTPNGDRLPLCAKCYEHWRIVAPLSEIVGA